MEENIYAMPAGVHAVPDFLLDLRSDADIDHDLMHPKPVSDEKNIWFFWHAGFERMYSYTQRNVRAWHRRFYKSGWVVRVLDCYPASVLNVANFLDLSDPANFPRSFANGAVEGHHARQHTSDLVRWPLLIKYGGVYADVGMMQIGDLERLWKETVANSNSPYDIIIYNCGDNTVRNFANYFFASRKDNPFFSRCHKLLLALWSSEEGKTSTNGMHANPLIKDVPLMEANFTLEENGELISGSKMSEVLTDYLIQCQVMSLVIGLVDINSGWDGPKYLAERIYAIEYMEGSQLINEYTQWDGQKAFRLMSLTIAKTNEEENPEQSLATEIVQACLTRSFGFKLAHGLITRVFGDTLGSLWRSHDGSDDVAGTYAHWLRHGMVHWTQDAVPRALKFEVIEPYKRGMLLKAE